jgi:iron(III) transport system permease protein
MRGWRKPVWCAVLGAAGLVALAAAAWLTSQDANQNAAARIGPLLRNTAILSGVVCAIALPSGAALAFLLFRTDAPARRFSLFALMAMLFAPLYVQAAGWEGGFGQNGWLSLAIGSQSQPLLAGWRAAIWIHTVAAIPWVALIVGAGLWLVDPETEEAALFEGGPLFVALRVTLPSASGAFVAAGLWTIISVAGEMTVTDLFKVRTFAEELYTGFALGENWRAALWRGAPAIAPITGLCIVAIAIAGSSPPSVWRTPRKRMRFALGRWRIFGGAIGLTAALLLAGVPLANLLIKAGLVSEPVAGEFTRRWSPAHFVSVIASTPRGFSEEFGWTFLLAAIAACLATAGGAALSWPAREFRLSAWPATLAAALSLAVPGPLVAMILIGLLNRPDASFFVYLYDQTLFAPAVAIAIRALPLAILITWHGWRTIPSEVLEAAAIDGAGAPARFFRVAAPMRRSTLVAAWLASFTVACGDLAASILVMPPGVSTVPTRTFGLLHSGVFDQVAGLCLVNIVVSGALTAGIAFFFSRQR